MQRQARLSSNGLAGAALALLMASTFALWLLPLDLIRGQSPYWSAQTEDITQYLSGFWAYISEPWQWPLWKIRSLNWPDGTLSTFVDIIPLYAALLKALVPASAGLYNPFGAWLVICLCLQAIGAWWILKEAKVADWVSLITLTGLLLTFPAWSERMGHTSLQSQWLLVFAYALVLRGWRLGNFPRWGWGLLLPLAFFINIYLCTMVWLVCCSQYLAFMTGNAKRGLIQWALAMVILMISLIGITMWPLPPASGHVESGFGMYSLNLLSPFTGGRALYQLAASASPQQQFEGFNYLGVGVFLLLIGVALRWLIWQLQGRLLLQLPAQPQGQEFATINLGLGRCRAYLVVMLVLATLYALSNRIYLGSELIFAWDLPAWATSVTGQLRASGRFFWLVGYAAIIFALLAIARGTPSNYRSLFLFLVLGLQVIDVWPHLTQFNGLAQRAPPVVLNAEQWQAQIPRGVSTIYFYPKMKCAQHSQAIQTLLPVQRLATETRRQMNTGYIARFNPLCHQESSEISSSDPGTSVYVFTNAEYGAAQVQGFFPPTWVVRCQRLDFASLCTAVDSKK